MKKTEASKPTGKDSHDLLPEYDFDYAKARPNRFAAEIKKESAVVSLDPDVAEVFKTSESVNTILRALIKSMPAPETTKPRGKQPSRQKHDDSARASRPGS